MKRRFIESNGLAILLSVSILSSCSSAPEKTGPMSHIVEIRAMQFQPAEIRVNKGDTVIFINRDMVVHDVTEEQSKKWASQPLSTDQSFSMIASQSSNYYCTIHPVMKGQVIVE